MHLELGDQLPVSISLRPGPVIRGRVILIKKTDRYSEQVSGAEKIKEVIFVRINMSFHGDSPPVRNMSEALVYKISEQY